MTNDLRHMTPSSPVPPPPPRTTHTHTHTHKHSVINTSPSSLAWWQGFPLIWPGDRVFYPNHFEQDSWLLQNCKRVKKIFLWLGLITYFYPKSPSLKLYLEIITANILSKIHDDNFKIITSSVLTMLSFDLARWPKFLAPSDTVSKWA